MFNIDSICLLFSAHRHEKSREKKKHTLTLKYQAYEPKQSKLYGKMCEFVSIYKYINGIKTQNDF